MSDTKPVVVFVLGPPGAGKGTQCERIVDTYKFKHLSAGDLLRAERNSGSETAELINGYIKEGKIVPVAITIELIHKAMEAHDGNLFLIDGFPRNADNFDGWAERMGDKVDARFVLFLDCDEETSTQRCLQRAASSGRVDDNVESLKKRHRTYEESTMPVIDLFRKEGMERRVDASESIDAVWEKVKEIFAEAGFTA
ncbi:cytidylate kinase [Salpingoeca rosetta]|uniref:UMP-CMP kinase n=1 Tax=Salpingoeca rosetta (strain ATCC 50818 / BSB-021) TaxID=946362 RepID=F2UNA6_SALR5|nr:cytidylate kinase [Salpingoeca rosetta]EGD79111.1 cytidylate kinase [Salpingoeca rosetta]|eukprot:XP_004989196.1 cytidylate kinase [Salpingoeca rosetta]